MSILKIMTFLSRQNPSHKTVNNLPSQTTVPKPLTTLTPLFLRTILPPIPLRGLRVLRGEYVLLDPPIHTNRQVQNLQVTWL